MKTNDDQEQTLSENLQEIRLFLEHIQPKIGEQAFNHIYAVVEEAIVQNEELTRIVKSDSVYTLLRFGSKNPSSSGVDDCEEQRYYYDLYNISCELRKKS
jgi:hypothetical protein